MAGPVLRTVSAGFGSAATSTSTQPPGSLYLMAFVTRLLISRSSSTGSPGTGRRRGLRRRRDLVFAASSAVCVEHSTRQLVQPDRYLARQPAVALCQDQQALDQLLVALVGAQQLGAEPAQVLARLRVIHRHLGQQPLHGQRGAQLVGGVGGEPALALVAGREPVERVVDRVGQLLLLVGGAAQPDPLAEVLRAESAHRLRRLRQRAERLARQRPPAPRPASTSEGHHHDPQAGRRHVAV